MTEEPGTLSPLPGSTSPKEGVHMSSQTPVACHDDDETDTELNIGDHLDKADTEGSEGVKGVKDCTRAETNQSSDDRIRGKSPDSVMALEIKGNQHPDIEGAHKGFSSSGSTASISSFSTKFSNLDLAYYEYEMDTSDDDDDESPEAGSVGSCITGVSSRSLRKLVRALRDDRSCMSGGKFATVRSPPSTEVPSDVSSDSMPDDSSSDCSSSSLDMSEGVRTHSHSLGDYYDDDDDYSDDLHDAQSVISGISRMTGVSTKSAALLVRALRDDRSRMSGGRFPTVEKQCQGSDAADVDLPIVIQFEEELHDKDEEKGDGEVPDAVCHSTSHVEKASADQSSCDEDPTVAFILAVLQKNARRHSKHCCSRQPMPSVRRRLKEEHLTSSSEVRNLATPSNDEDMSSPGAISKLPSRVSRDGASPGDEDDILAELRMNARKQSKHCAPRRPMPSARWRPKEEQPTSLKDEDQQATSSGTSSEVEELSSPASQERFGELCETLPDAHFILAELQKNARKQSKHCAPRRPMPSAARQRPEEEQPTSLKDEDQQASEEAEELSSPASQERFDELCETLPDAHFILAELQKNARKQSKHCAPRRPMPHARRLEEEQATSLETEDRAAPSEKEELSSPARQERFDGLCEVLPDAHFILAELRKDARKQSKHRCPRQPVRSVGRVHEKERRTSLQVDELAALSGVEALSAPNPSAGQERVFDDSLATVATHVLEEVVRRLSGSPDDDDSSECMRETTESTELQNDCRRLSKPLCPNQPAPSTPSPTSTGCELEVENVQQVIGGQRPGMNRQVSSLSVDDSVVFDEDFHLDTVGGKLDVIDEAVISQQETALRTNEKKTGSRVVSFSSVEVRHYKRILGDHPCTSGPPLAIDWEYDPHETLNVSVDEHEDLQAQRRPERDTTIAAVVDLTLSREKRMNMLRELGYTEKEIAAAVRQARKDKRRRRRTVLNLGTASKVEELAESAGRKVKKVLTKRQRRQISLYAGQPKDMS